MQPDKGKTQNPVSNGEAAGDETSTMLMIPGAQSTDLRKPGAKRKLSEVSAAV